MRRVVMVTVLALQLAGLSKAQLAPPPAPQTQVPMAPTSDTQTAQKMAGAWMRAVDDGDYDGSYEQASSIFKAHITKEAWAKKIAATRAPLGKALSHTVKGSRYTTSLKGAPAGEYVLIQLASSFENKKAVVEELVVMLDKDGHWRVTGYVMK